MSSFWWNSYNEKFADFTVTVADTIQMLDSEILDFAEDLVSSCGINQDYKIMITW